MLNPIYKPGTLLSVGRPPDHPEVVCPSIVVPPDCRDPAGTEPCVVAAQCAESKMPVGREGQHVVHGAQHACAQGRGA